MGEYSDIKTIEDLYNEEEISGKSYLFCVDNDIDTLQDLQKFIAEASSCENVPDDLLCIYTNNSRSETEQKCEANPNHIESKINNEDALQRRERLYANAIKGCSIRAFHSLARIRKECQRSGTDFYQFLLAADLQKQLQAIRNIGQKTYTEIETIANKIRLGLDDVLRRYDDLYIAAIKECSVRSKNCLSVLEQDLKYPSKDFFNFLLDPDLEKRLLSVRNAGKKTIAEICQAVESIRAELDNPNLSAVAPIKASIKLDFEQEESFSDIWFIIDQMIIKYSVRCQNVINKIISDSNNSIVQLYNYFRSTEYNPDKIRNIGKKTCVELDSFCQEYISIVDMYMAKDPIITNAIDEKNRTLKYKAITNLGESDVLSVMNLSNTLNHPPLFKIIDCVIRQDDRTQAIISKATKVYNGAIIDVDSVSGTLRLTRERVRQLRNKYIEDFIDKIQIWKKHFDFSHYEQYCSALCDKGNIFKEEGVDFSDDFIDIVSSVLFSDNYTLVGDMHKCIMSPYDKKEALFIIPNKLATVFDFEKLLADIEKRISDIIYDDYQIDLRHDMLNYFVDVIKFDLVDEIMEYLSLMLFERFQIVAENNMVRFAKNSTKTIPELIEDILEENGDIMTLDKIYEIFNAKYPGLTKNKDTMRSCIRNSNRIAPISRTGSYALKEWSSKGIKTGTIRDLVYDYLLGFSTPQSLADIESYVVQYRPDTDANSINNNLALDNKGLFTLLVLNDKRYVAISTHDYDSKFVNIKDGGSYTAKRTYQESFDVLYQFVLEHDRFPFLTSKNDEEVRISRFLSIVRVRRKNNTLSEDELLILNRFESEFGDKEIAKDQYNWNIRFSELENYILVYGKLPTVKGDSSLYTWVNKQKTSIAQGKLREEDAVKINNLLTQVL